LAHGGEHMGRIRTLLAARAEEALLARDRQQGFEELGFRVPSQEAGPELREPGVMKAGIRELQAEEILPIETAPDLIGRLAIGKVLGKLE
jgi:hypothetical protein